MFCRLILRKVGIRIALLNAGVLL